MTSLRIGKHRIVKNIASLRKVNIAHPYREAGEAQGDAWVLVLLVQSSEQLPAMPGELRLAI